MTKQRNRKGSGKVSGEQKPRSAVATTILTTYDLATLKSIIPAYMAYLVHLDRPESRETHCHLQALYERLPEQGEGAIYFTYEERVALIQATIGFQVLLVRGFPRTELRDIAQADVQCVYRCLVYGQTLPLN